MVNGVSVVACSSTQREERGVEEDARAAAEVQLEHRGVNRRCEQRGEQRGN